MALRGPCFDNKPTEKTEVYRDDNTLIISGTRSLLEVIEVGHDGVCEAQRGDKR